MLNELYRKLGATGDYTKMCIGELVYRIICEPSNNCNVGDRRNELRKAIFGDNYGSVQEKVLDVAGYWYNDLEVIVKESLNYDGSISSLLFDWLQGKEIIYGVGYMLD